MGNYVCYQNHKYFYAASEELGSYGSDEPASCSHEDLFREEFRFLNITCNDF